MKLFVTDLLVAILNVLFFIIINNNLHISPQNNYTLFLFKNKVIYLIILFKLILNTRYPGSIVPLKTLGLSGIRKQISINFTRRFLCFLIYSPITNLHQSQSLSRHQRAGGLPRTPGQQPAHLFCFSLVQPDLQKSPCQDTYHVV